MNHMLISDFTTNECRRALKQMYLLKAPRPDGMLSLFFQHFWTTSGEMVTKTVLAIANRLKKIFPSIICDTQSAFVHGRLITDNVFLAFETMHHIS